MYWVRPVREAESGVVSERAESGSEVVSERAESGSEVRVREQRGLE